MASLARSCMNTKTCASGLGPVLTRQGPRGLAHLRAPGMKAGNSPGPAAKVTPPHQNGQAPLPGIAAPGVAQRESCLILASLAPPALSRCRRRGAPQGRRFSRLKVFCKKLAPWRGVRLSNFAPKNLLCSIMGCPTRPHKRAWLR